MTFFLLEMEMIKKIIIITKIFIRNDVSEDYDDDVDDDDEEDGIDCT